MSDPIRSYLTTACLIRQWDPHGLAGRLPSRGLVRSAVRHYCLGQVQSPVGVCAPLAAGQQLKDEMQLFVHPLGVKYILNPHMRSEGALSVGKGTEPSEKATDFFPSLPRWTVRPLIRRSAEANSRKG